MPIQFIHDKRTYLYALTLSMCFSATAFAQQSNTTKNRIPRTKLHSGLSSQQSRSGEQRVQRQAEILRLEQIIDDLRDRIERLERFHNSSNRLPMITVAEAQANLEYAEAQRTKAPAEEENAGGAAHVQDAKDRIAIVQARGQLAMAKAASQEAILAMELEVLYYQRRYTSTSVALKQLERLAARGLTSTEGLQTKMMDLQTAEKELQLAQLRLKTQQTLAALKTPEQISGE